MTSTQTVSFSADELEKDQHAVEVIAFTVLGIPQTAGSKRTIPIKNRRTGEWVHRANGTTLTVTVDDNPKGASWKQSVASAARTKYSGPLIDGPIGVTMVFRFPHPKFHHRTGRNSALLRDGISERHITRPDVLKLARCAEDALTGVLWRDDSQICCELLSKCYGEPAGAEIRVWEIHDSLGVSDKK